MSVWCMLNWEFDCHFTLYFLDDFVNFRTSCRDINSCNIFSASRFLSAHILLYDATIIIFLRAWLICSCMYDDKIMHYCHELCTLFCVCSLKRSPVLVNSKFCPWRYSQITASFSLMTRCHLPHLYYFGFHRKCFKLEP